MKKSLLLFKEFSVSVPSNEHKSKSILEQYEMETDKHTIYIPGFVYLVRPMVTNDRFIIYQSINYETRK